MKKSGLFGVLVLSFFIVSTTSSYGEIINGTQVGSITEVNVDLPEFSLLVDPPPVPATTVIDFDDVVAPCSFIETTALYDHYGGLLGVHFIGPGGNDGGAILDECGGFGVTGHSSPNFLAFNNSGVLSDGGVPQGPEAIYFEHPVNHVQVNVGAGEWNSGTVDMLAWDVLGYILDSTSVDISDVLQPIAITTPLISFIEISYSSDELVIDDLTFDPEQCFDDGMEENDDFATATPVTEGFYPALELCWSDPDYFSIDLDVDDEITVELLFPHAEGDINLFLFDSTEPPYVAHSESTDDNEWLTYTSPVAGTYYIVSNMVHDTGSGLGNNYDMVIEVVSPCIDLDGDGYGDPANPECRYPQLDCDDGNHEVNPGQEEVPDNGIDDDCDGQIDEGCFIGTVM